MFLWLKIHLVLGFLVAGAGEDFLRLGNGEMVLKSCSSRQKLDGNQESYGFCEFLLKK